MGVPLLRLDRLCQRHETYQASTEWQWQPSPLRPGFERV